MPLPPPLLPPHIYLYAATALRAAAVGGGGWSSLLLARSLAVGWWERSLPDWMRSSNNDAGEGGGAGPCGGGLGAA